MASDLPRFHELSALYGYLTKQFTIFGQHIHIGCPDADAALLMLHRMSRYIPHFIALSASSPFVQGHDTAFDSARLNSVFAFPLSGRAPCVLTWQAFEAYFDKMTATGVVKSMKDFYWDIRPKPEFGTIEIRVFDTPLTIERAAALAGYVQSLAAWMLLSLAFSYYVENLAHYTQLYGSIATIVVVLLWLYMSGTVLILGGELNAVVLHRRTQRRRAAEEKAAEEAARPTRQEAAAQKPSGATQPPRQPQPPKPAEQPGKANPPKPAEPPEQTQGQPPQEAIPPEKEQPERPGKEQSGS